MPRRVERPRRVRVFARVPDHVHKVLLFKQQTTGQSVSDQINKGLERLYPDMDELTRKADSFFEEHHLLTHRYAEDDPQ